MIFDCVIIGGGPAGLNAALVLGRARRRTVLFDNNKPRNAVTNEFHGFLTRDGEKLQDFRALAHAELNKYPSVQVKNEKILDVKKLSEGIFELTTKSGLLFYSRKIVLATGLRESLPPITGIVDFYGTSLFSCPYCDGWELREQPLVLITENIHAMYMTKLILNWSQDLIVCTNGNAVLSPEEKKSLQRKNVRIEDQRISRLQGENGYLEKIIFSDGTEIKRSGGFITPPWKLASTIGLSLGCKVNDLGGIDIDDFGRTNVNHIYAAGDTSTIAPSQAIVAAAAGSRAAIGVNTDLTMEDF